MPRPNRDVCEAIKSDMEGNKKRYEENMARARGSDQEAARYIAKNNDMVKEVQREIGRLGVNTLIRNRSLKLLAGISFLEELDVLDTPQEKNLQIRALMARLMAAHHDAVTAVAVVQEFLAAADHEKANYEAKKKIISECEDL